MGRHFNLLLVGVVVVGLGLGAFLASLQSKSAESSQAAGRTGAALFTAQSPQSAAGQADQGQGGTSGQSRPVMGSIASLQGDTLTVTAQQGEVKVKTAGARIEKTAEGTADDLKAGTSVVISGQSGADGVFTASTVRIAPAGATAAQPVVVNRGQSGQAQGQSQSPGQGQRPTQGQGQSAAGPGQSQGAAGQAQSPAAATGQARAVAGTVASLEGDTLTVTAQQGQTKVKLSGARIEKTVEGTPGDLKPGERVLVTGQQGSDGSYAAETIQIVSPGDAPGARSGR